MSVQLPSWARYAALGMILVGAAVGAGKVLLPFPYGARLSTGPQESQVTTLKDGSKIHLDPDSEVIVSYDRHDRLIDARHGQFVLDVHKDEQEPARPFIVATGYGQIRALGTQFGVTYRPPEPVVVNVSHGRVVITPSRKLGDGSAAADVVVEAGERVALSSEGAVTGATKSTVKREGEFFYFSAATLAEMVAHFNLSNEQKIHVYGDVTEASAQIPPLSGVFKANDPRAFMEFLMRIRVGGRYCWPTRSMAFMCALDRRRHARRHDEWA